MNPAQGFPEIAEPTRNRLVCITCVREAFLSKQIEESGAEGVCSYCETTAITFSIDRLADLVSFALKEHFERSYPTDLTPGNEWIGGVVDVIGTAACIDEPIAEDIRKILADRYEATGIEIESPDEAPFARGAHYEERSEVDDWEFHSDWRNFEETLKTEARYFSRNAELILWSIFEGLEAQTTSGGNPVIVAGGPDTAIPELYRARTVQTVTKLRTVLIRPDKEVGPPPASAAVAGRMNARGISVFYGSTDPEVAIAEVRPPVGSQVVVGRFDVIRPVRLLDLNALESVNIAEGSVFDEDYTRRRKRARFLAWLSERITIPVMPDDETGDYLATQAIADFLSGTLDPPLDGIIYRSTQIEKPIRLYRHTDLVGVEKLNVAIFHNAARLRPMSVPEGTEILVQSDSFHSSLDSSFDLGHLEKGPDEKYSVAEMVTNDTLVTSEFYDENELLGELESQAYDLKLDVGSLCVHWVSGVKFSTKSNPVFRYRSLKTNAGEPSDSGAPM